MPRLEGIDKSGSPIGVPFPVAYTATNPVKSLLCDGTIHLIADFPFLYAKILTKYGGDGLTTFGVPDMRGRTLICLDNLAASGSVAGPAGVVTNGSADIVGGVSGSENQTLSIANMPSHNHGGGNHDHQISGRAGNGASEVLPKTRSDNFLATVRTDFSGAVISSQGSGSAHNNMQPWMAQSWFIAYL